MNNKIKILLTEFLEFFIENNDLLIA